MSGRYTARRLCTTAVAVAVDAFTPTDELEDSTPAGVEEEHWVPTEDTALYLVQFRTERLPYSTTVRTALEGQELVDCCYKAAQEFVNSAAEMFPEHASKEMAVVLLGITKLPG